MCCILGKTLLMSQLTIFQSRIWQHLDVKVWLSREKPRLGTHAIVWKGFFVCQWLIPDTRPCDLVSWIGFQHLLYVLIRTVIHGWWRTSLAVILLAGSDFSIGYIYWYVLWSMDDEEPHWLWSCELDRISASAVYNVLLWIEKIQVHEQQDCIDRRLKVRYFA